MLIPKIHKTVRQKAIESVVNDDVIKVNQRVFRWRNMYFEVMMNWELKVSQWQYYMPIKKNGKKYLIRELTYTMAKKKYPEIKSKVKWEWDHGIRKL
jgi:hypothetical protein